MSFPVFETATINGTAVNSTSHIINTPASIMSGDLLIAFITLQNLTSPATQFTAVTDGFTKIKDKTTGGVSGASMGVFYKISDGTEGSDITVTSVDSERSVQAMYRISNFEPTIAPEINAGASGLSTSPDPASLSPAGGAKDYMFLALCGWPDNVNVLTGFPTGYGNSTTGGQASGGSLGIATKNVNAASEDPATFSIAGAEEWQAFTLAVHPPDPPPAITRLDTAASNAATSTLAYSVSAGSDRMLVVTVTVEDNSGAVVDSIDYGGQAMVKVREEIANVGGVEAGLSVWYLLEAGIAAASTNVITPTFNPAGDPDAHTIHAASYEGVDQPNPVVEDKGDFTDSSTPNPITTVDLVEANGNLIYAAGVVGDGPSTSTWQSDLTEQTQAQDATMEGSTADRLSTTFANVTVELTWGSQNRAAIISVHFQKVVATAVITGTATAAIDEADVVAGGKTIIITLTGDEFQDAGNPFDNNRQNIINGLDSAQSELTGWNNEVRDKQLVAGVVRTSSTVVTITLDAQAGYNISAQETITVTLAAAVLKAGFIPIVATPTFDVAVGPIAAVLSGTITPASTEAQIVAGGRTLLITLDNDTWVASGAAFNAARQAIIDGITSAQSEVTGWNNEVRDNLPVGQVTRTSDTVVTVTFNPETGYNITDFEEITVTVPAAALVLSGSPVVATPTFFIFEVPIAIVTGTVVPDAEVSEIVAGGETIILTLIDDEWVAAGATFNAVRQDIIDGLDSSGVEATGWNAEVRDNLPVTAVVRTSPTVVTITLTAQAGYSITVLETITVTVPGSALDQTPNPITGVPTFDVLAPGGTHMRDRRGGQHAEDIFDVNEPNVETFPVNKFE